MKMKFNKWIVPVSLLSLVTLSGCGMTRASQRPPAPVAVVKSIPPEMLAPKKGSIWQSTDRNTLFLDNKARNIGDIITVNISEKASAEHDATTETKRANTNASSLGGALDLTTVLRSNQTLASATAASQNDFKGEGNTTRDSSLVASISCLVTEVLPNGNLRIEGRRDLTINHENQFILLSGIVRPEDITPANTVTSTQVADARIDFSGDGDIDQNQKPSWISQFFSTINIL